MRAHDEHVQRERTNYDFFLSLPPVDRTDVHRLDAKGSQFLEPLFEYSGACAGCGETPYLKLLTQLFGDRALIANATGCSSIYGGNLPTTPYCTNRQGRGPAWSNSLFEDNAEFGLGFHLAVDQHAHRATDLLEGLASQIGQDLVTEMLRADQNSEAGLKAQRLHVETLRQKLREIGHPQARTLEELADYLVRKSVWIVGGDGWAYDIGFGGLDHVLASGCDVNILVLDTEVYSNTGGQQSKATPLGASAKFAIAGKEIHKKDLGLMAMSYGHVYVASVAFGANENQTVQAFLDAESYPGPSLIIAYSHCIAHGYDLRFRRRSTEAGSRFGCLAALPIRSAPCTGRPAAATSGHRKAQRICARLYGERSKVPYGRENRPTAVPSPGPRSETANQPTSRPVPTASATAHPGRRQRCRNRESPVTFGFGDLMGILNPWT